MTEPNLDHAHRLEAIADLQSEREIRARLRKVLSEVEPPLSVPRRIHGMTEREYRQYEEWELGHDEYPR